MDDVKEEKHPSIKHADTTKKLEQYLTFLLQDDEYGIEILAVQEIHGWVAPRPIPNTPKYIKGVIDWRGTVVPIVDLRIRFGYENATYNSTTVVIVLKALLEEIDEYAIVGVVVDAVSDVHDVGLENMRKAPSFGSKVDTRYIKGIAKMKDDMIVLLNLGKLINLNDLEK